MADPSDDIEVPGLGAEDDPMADDMPDVDVKKEKDLTGDGGLIKKIITEGSGWETPSKGDSVTVHYHGTLEDGSVFDSSRDRGDPFVFTIGQGQVIKGWDQGVITMKRGEKALLTCKSDYAYGEAGSPPKIPPKATLHFEVELLSWKSIKDIAGDGGIIKTIETEGKGWEKPKDKDEALVKYAVRATGSSTAVVASPEEGAVVQVGSGQPLKAFPVALKSMKQGEKASLKIKPEYGFASPHEGVPEGAELEADLELVTIRKVEDVTDDGKVVTKLVRKGKDYKRPNEGATVKVAYTGRIGGPNGPVFEEHSKESPLEFVTDEDAVVEGLDMAVMKHNEDEAFEVTVAPEYGFGDREEKRALATVPPNSQLHYAVEILEVQKAKESWDLSNEDKVELAKKRKEQGNALFKAGKWARAIAKYKSAADTVGYDKDFSEELKKECAAIKKSADLNKAAASLKLHNYRDAIAAASKVLEAEPGNVKALYRRAQGHLAEQDLVEAELDIRAALLVEPNNKDVRALKLRYKKEAAAANAKDKAMYQRAFQKLAKMPDTEPKAPQAAPEMTEADSKPEPESHPIDIMDSAASEALLIDEEQPAAADTPAENGHLHAGEKDTLEAAPVVPQRTAVES